MPSIPAARTLLSLAILGACSATMHAEPHDAQESYTITFCGDTGFGEFYECHDLEKPGVHILESRGYDYGFEKVRPLVAGSDTLIVNLETAITDRQSSPLSREKKYLHSARVDHAPPVLVGLGVDAVSLANNHTLDFGAEGLEDTIEALDDANIAYFGAGENLAAAAKPYTFNITLGDTEQTIVILAGFEHRLRYQFQYGFYAEDTRSGVNPWNADLAAEQALAARKAHPDAIIIAYPHWGANYQWANEHQKGVAQSLIDAGCDIVIGHGGHMLQEVDRMGDNLVVYGLGNFVFHSPGRYKIDGCTPYSFVARLTLTKEHDEIVAMMDLYPILSDNLKTNYQPRPADQFEALVAITDVVSKATDENLARNIRPQQDELGWKISIEALRKPIAQSAGADASR